ncbi:MAG TPA: DUF2946 family protein [Micropepsaceae bacterium]|nr:DUF2946 family protein [Micropepsaceae bacterium]
MSLNRHEKRQLARERPCVAVVRAPSVARVVMGLLALLAIALQSFVVQTHIHMGQGSSGIQTISIITAAKHIGAFSAPAAAPNDATPRDKYPITEDPSNCPLCQEIAHSGQFLHSAAALAAIPASVSVHFIIFSEALPSFFAVSHSWHSRAPPSRSTGS